MKKLSFLIALSLSLTSQAATALEPPPKPDTGPARVVATSPKMIIALDGKPIAEWELGTPGEIDYDDLSDISGSKSGRLCIVTKSGKACHKLKSGQVGHYQVKFKSQLYPAYLRL